MDMRVPEYIQQITPYPPGKSLAELERQYGVTDAIKLASNENPWGPSPKAVAAIQAALPNLHRYPDGGHALTRALADKLDCAPEMLVFGNGSDEVIEFLVKALMEPGDEAISSFPSFLMYQKFVQIRGGKNIVLPLKDMRHDLEGIAARVTKRTRLIFLDNPNNPTGTAFGEAAFLDFLARLPESVVVALDEAYVDFADPKTRLDSVALIKGRTRGPRIAALRTFSKAYGLAGLRLGYGVADAELAAVLGRVRGPFDVNLLAQIGGPAALADEEHYRRAVDGARAGMAFLRAEVEKLGCRAWPSEANFFLIDARGEAAPLYEAMLRRGVIVRSMQSHGYPDRIRVTVGTEPENRRFLAAFAESLQELGRV